MKRLLELGAIFDDPSVNGGVIHLHPPFLHEFFDIARAQRVRHIPADPHQNNLWGEMGTFEIDRHPSLSLMIHGCSERRMIPQNASSKNCDKTPKSTARAPSSITTPSAASLMSTSESTASGCPTCARTW